MYILPGGAFGHLLEAVGRRLRIMAPVALTVAQGLIAPAAAVAHPASQERLELINHRIETEPQNPDLYASRGRVHAEDQHWDEALADYEQAIELGLDPDVADFLRGELFLISERPADAEVYLDRLLKRRPNHALGRKLRARARAALGRQGEAAADFVRVLEDSPGASPDLYLEVIRSLNAAERPREALRLADEGCERFGALTSLATQAVELEVAAGMYEEALTRLAALEKSPGFRERWLVRRAEILELVERPGEARAVWEQARTALAGRPAHRRQAERFMELQRKIDRGLARLAETQ